MNPQVSIIVPVFNEAPNLEPLVEEITAAMGPLGLPYELIVVDDGSRDGSRDLLLNLKGAYPPLRIVFLMRNYGQSAAMTAGFDHARGDVVVTMDGDLQNDPQDIPHLIAEIDKGFDLVSGWRRNRRDPFFSKKLPSVLANKFIGTVTGLKLHDYGCTLKAYRSHLAKTLLLYGELHRLIPILARMQGARISEVQVRHHPRKRGKTKYGIGRAYRVLLDLLLMLFFQKFATRPLQLFGLGGGLSLTAGLIMEVYLTWVKLWRGEQIGGRPLLLLGVLLILAGIILFGIGLLAELVIRTYHESTGRSIYGVKEIVD
jgi:glycosyltransferase involved in cell wall biosynthesis